MKGLPTLIKISRRELDTIRKQLAALARQKEGLEMALHNTITEIENESEFAAGNTGLARFFGSFFKKARARKQVIERSIIEVNDRMAETEEKLYVAFGNLKKLEIAKSNIEKRKAEAETLHEGKLMDELGGQAFARREDENYS